ncbi:putative U1A small nuclear ribonucleoprotein [Trypanosoma theileri]|uniref:Putative U1A small nuclear ribonucleoprotein n=1 Tax=Trypanosoma theileri TaxID=67003 RepID=A0A1X0NL51_9TRYP|nr:putative U1A small nuclear ribonucleoprotein [Trypanosoma theileri]ORC85494.1 putative U1A small nuclear ribonucleoprotein [Trypanosoma theileri]
MEILRIRGLKFNFGVEFSRLTILRCFGEYGPLYDVLLDVPHGEALVSYVESASAQDAYLKMNGFLLFGEPIEVSITAPPVSDIPGWTVTYRPSRYLIVRGASYLWVELNLRHVKGVDAIQSIDANTTVASFENQTISTAIKRLLDGRIAYNGKSVLVLYLKQV